MGSKYTTSEQVTVTEWQWVSDDEIADVIISPILCDDHIYDDDPTINNGGSMQLVTRTYTVIHNHYYENDGIVTVPSQERWSEARKITVDGTDHESAKRSINVCNKLMAEFDNHNSWFYLKRK